MSELQELRILVKQLMKRVDELEKENRFLKKRIAELEAKNNP